MGILKKSLQNQLYYKKLATQIPALLEADEKMLFGDSTVVTGEAVGATGSVGMGYYLAVTDKRIILKKATMTGTVSQYDTLFIDRSSLLRLTKEGYKVVAVFNDGRIMKFWSLDHSSVYADNLIRLLQANM